MGLFNRKTKTTKRTGIAEAGVAVAAILSGIRTLKNYIGERVKKKR